MRPVTSDLPGIVPLERIMRSTPVPMDVKESWDSASLPDVLGVLLVYLRADH